MRSLVQLPVSPPPPHSLRPQGSNSTRLLLLLLLPSLSRPLRPSLREQADPLQHHHHHHRHLRRRGESLRFCRGLFWSSSMKSRDEGAAKFCAALTVACAHCIAIKRAAAPSTYSRWAARRSDGVHAHIPPVTGRRLPALMTFVAFCLLDGRVTDVTDRVRRDTSLARRRSSWRRGAGTSSAASR